MGEWTQRDFPPAMLNAKAPAKIDLSLSVAGQAITLSWTAPENNGNADDNGLSDPVHDHQGLLMPTATAVDENNRMWGDGTVGGDINPTPGACNELYAQRPHSGSDLLLPHPRSECV